MARTRSVRIRRRLDRQERTKVAAAWRRYALRPSSRVLLDNDEETPSRQEQDRKKVKREPKEEARSTPTKQGVVTVGPPPPLNGEVLVRVLQDLAALCPYTAWRCRLVSREWRRAATHVTVQQVIWAQCIGQEETNPTDSTATPLADVAAALAKVEQEILTERYNHVPGYPFVEQNPALEWLNQRFAEARRAVTGSAEHSLDEGMAVRKCVDRKWWRAAETLIRECKAVDHCYPNPQWGILAGFHGPHIAHGTGEDAILDAAVDAGDVQLCHALLCCPHTAASQGVSMYKLPIYQYGFGHAAHPRGHLFHSVEAFRNGHMQLAAMLVSPQEGGDIGGGGGQYPIPLLQVLCSGQVTWTTATAPVIQAALRGVKAYTRKLETNLNNGRLISRRSRVLLDELRGDLEACRLQASQLNNARARAELLIGLESI